MSCSSFGWWWRWTATSRWMKARCAEGTSTLRCGDGVRDAACALECAAPALPGHSRWRARLTKRSLCLQVTPRLAAASSGHSCAISRGGLMTRSPGWSRRPASSPRITGPSSTSACSSNGRGMNGQALEHYQAAVALRPDSPWARYNRARLYQVRGDWYRRPMISTGSCRLLVERVSPRPVSSWAS